MQYLLLIYENEKLSASMSPEAQKANFQRYFKFTEDVRNAGAYIDGNPLQESHTATSVRVRNGQRTLTDGPFAETREQLGGYYLLDCASLDDAIKWAAQIPASEVGTVEIRPVFDPAAMR